MMGNVAFQVARNGGLADQKLPAIVFGLLLHVRHQSHGAADRDDQNAFGQRIERAGVADFYFRPFVGAEVLQSPLGDVDDVT